MTNANTPKCSHVSANPRACQNDGRGRAEGAAPDFAMRTRIRACRSVNGVFDGRTRGIRVAPNAHSADALAWRSCVASGHPGGGTGRSRAPALYGCVSIGDVKPGRLSAPCVVVQKSAGGKAGKNGQAVEKSGDGPERLRPPKVPIVKGAD